MVLSLQGMNDQFQRMGLQPAGGGMPRPTICPAQNFNAEKDTEIIRQAMKGAGNVGYVTVVKRLISFCGTHF